MSTGGRLESQSEPGMFDHDKCYLVICMISNYSLHSWNRDLANDRGTYMGKEYRKKGVNMILGPVVGPLGRVALGGRNWEGFSTDPYLSGILVSESVKGLQSQNVATSLKVCLFQSSVSCKSNTRVALYW